MASTRFEHLLGGDRPDALALALTPYARSALAASDAEITAAVPMPESADLPPPSISEIWLRPQLTHPLRLQRLRRPQQRWPIRCQHPLAPSPPPLRFGDTSVVDKLREQLAGGKFDRILGGKKERATVEAFYSTRNFAPLWIADGAMSDRAKAARPISPASMPTASTRPNIRCRRSRPARARRRGRSRDQVHRHGADLRAPRPDGPRALQPRLGRHRLRPGQARAGRRAGPLASGQDAAAALDSLNPPQPGTRRSRPSSPKSATARPTSQPVIPPGPVLKYARTRRARGPDGRPARAGAARVVQPEGRRTATPTTTRTLSDAIAKFQKEQHLAPTGSSPRRRSTPSTGRSARRPSTSSSPTWSAGAGCRATSARPT